MPQPDLTLTPAGPALAPRYREHPTSGPLAPAPALVRHRPPHRPEPRNPYLRLFALPGTRAFTAGNLIARLPMGMFGVSAVIMIAGRYDSYALAGSVIATGLAAGALAAPWIARLVDRYGQARVAVPATAYAVLGHLLLLLCVHEKAPAWALFLVAATTATSPNTGGMSRARWAHLLRDDPDALHTANAFEQAVDELCFMLGPVLAALLCSALFPEAGTLVAAALFLSGVLLFAAQRSTEPPIAPRTATGSPLRAPGMVPLLAVFLATGAIFGSMEVVALAFVDGPVAGPVLALQAAGSCAAGLLYGRARRTARLRTCLAAMTVLMAMPLLAASTGSLLALAGGLLVAGMATAPTMVTGMGLVQRLTPASRLNEGMTLAVTALLAGIAAGSATGGWAADHAPFPAFGFLVPIAAAALALTLCATTGVGGPRPRVRA
ncbi:MFS transporter [Streptomyces sp. WAC01280]|uniref:MFS transporter n=1 Tax=Streptomyces sp. WAC01280 TaxID=2487424 RepID=UPI000F79F548|nr:MFS transporter [Streptomyces sp. WAC01280]RSS50787.1 MFS transporter [Streptomyces sp. WAC01280]